MKKIALLIAALSVAAVSHAQDVTLALDNGAVWVTKGHSFDFTGTFTAGSPFKILDAFGSPNLGPLISGVVQGWWSVQTNVTLGAGTYSGVIASDIWTIKSTTANGAYAVDFTWQYSQGGHSYDIVKHTTVNVVPEPISFFPMGIGVAGLLIRRRRN